MTELSNQKIKEEKVTDLSNMTIDEVMEHADKVIEDAKLVAQKLDVLNLVYLIWIQQCKRSQESWYKEIIVKNK